MSPQSPKDQDPVTFSVNLSKLQAILALIVHASVILTAALWIGRVLVASEFQTQLDIFHSHAKPEIEQMVDSKIGEFDRARIGVSAAEKETASGRFATLEQQVRDQDAQLTRIEAKVDRLLERR